MKSFIGGFRTKNKYYKCPVIAENEERAKKLIKANYEELSLIGTPEILEIFPCTLSEYWTQNKMKRKIKKKSECEKCEFGLPLIYGNPQLYCIYFKDVEPPRCEIINPTNGTCQGFLCK